MIFTQKDLAFRAMLVKPVFTHLNRVLPKSRTEERRIIDSMSKPAKG
jgi:hypothetical protein